MKGENKILRYIILAVLVSRLMMYLYFIIFYHTGDFIAFTNQMNQWDCGWYHEIAISGYLPKVHERGMASWAFFPFYPTLLSLIHRVIPSDPYQISFVVSNLCFIGAMYFGFQYMQLIGCSVKSGYRYVFFITFGMYAFYFSCIYTEAPFLLLLTACFYFMEKRNYLVMGLCGMMLSATRNMGVFFAIALLVHWICRYVKEYRKSVLDFIVQTFRQPKLVIGALMIPIGLVCYMIFLYFFLGDPLAFVHVQAGWGRENHGAIYTLFHALTDKLVSSWFYWACWSLWGFVLTGYLFYKKRIPEAVFAVIYLLIPLQSSTESMSRYITAGFVFYLAFADWAERWPKWFRIACATGTVLVEFVLQYLWFVGSGIVV